MRLGLPPLLIARGAYAERHRPPPRPDTPSDPDARQASVRSPTTSLPVSRTRGGVARADNLIAHSCFEPGWLISSRAAEICVAVLLQTRSQGPVRCGVAAAARTPLQRWSSGSQEQSTAGRLLQQ